MSRRIFLRDYEVVASIGIHEFERQNPQRIIIDVALEIAEGASAGNGQDRIETVLDYAIKGLLIAKQFLTMVFYDYILPFAENLLHNL